MYLDELLKRAEAIEEEILAPNATAVDDEAQWPEEGMRALQEAGLGGLVVPREYGGLGHGLLALGKVSEILARGCAATALCYSMHQVGTAMISANPTPYQKKHFLGPICAGDHVTTIAMSEASSGSQFWLPDTKLDTTDRDTYLISGEKRFVTNGGYADSYVVSTVAANPDANPDAPPGHFSLVVVPADTKGLHWLEPWSGVGMRGNASNTVQIKTAEVPRAALLGEEGEQISYFFEVLSPYFLLSTAGVYVGIANAAFETALRHVKSRTYEHSGESLSRMPVVQHRLGELFAELERTRALLHRAAEAADANGAATMAVLCAARADAGTCAVHIANEAMTLVGGTGYRANTTIARNLRDARAAHVMTPSTDVLRTWTGRAVLGEPLLGD